MQKNGKGEPIPPLASESDLDAAFAESANRPVFLFKHSPTCPVSAAAWAEFRAFAPAAAAAGAALRVVDVIAARAVSRLAAERTRVKHESPQALVILDGTVRRHASHGTLVVEWFEAALAAVREEKR